MVSPVSVLCGVVSLSGSLARPSIYSFSSLSPANYCKIFLSYIWRIWTILISMPYRKNQTVTYTEPGMEASRWSRFFFSFALNDDLRTERRTPPSFSAPVISRWLEQSLPDNSEVFSNFMFLVTVLSWFSSSSLSSWLDKNASTFLSSENPAERN